MMVAISNLQIIQLPTPDRMTIREKVVTKTPVLEEVIEANPPDRMTISEEIVKKIPEIEEVRVRMVHAGIVSSCFWPLFCQQTHSHWLCLERFCSQHAGWGGSVDALMTVDDRYSRSKPHRC